jgi:hypothetical protein
MVHACNTSTWEAEAEGLQVWGQPGLCSETLIQKVKGNKIPLQLDSDKKLWNAVI